MTTAFITDDAAKRKTLEQCRNAIEFRAAMAEWDAFKADHPDWSLVIPARFRMFVDDGTFYRRRNVDGSIEHGYSEDLVVTAAEPTPEAL